MYQASCCCSRHTIHVGVVNRREAYNFGYIRRRKRKQKIEKFKNQGVTGFI